MPKMAGGTITNFFKRVMNEHALERQSIEGSLRHALDRGEFVLHYQPKLDLKAQTSPEQTPQIPAPPPEPRHPRPSL